MAHNRKNRQCAVLERRQRVAGLYLEGKTQLDIAQRVGVSQYTVSIDLQYMKDQWLASGLVAFDEKRAIEVEKLNKVEAAAWEAWERSTQPGVTTKKGSVEEVKPIKVREAEKGKKAKYESQMVPTKTIDETVTRHQVGDPRFLEQVYKCIELRLKLIGALKDLNPTFNFVNLNWEDLHGPPDEPDKINAKIEAARNGMNGASHADQGN